MRGTAAALPQPRPKPLPHTIIVGSGDSLYLIGKRYQVPLRALIDANRLEPPYRLYPGQELTLPKTRTHKVAEGESLYGISRHHSVDTAQLASLNGLTPPYTIYAGQELRLPATAITGEPWALPEHTSAARRPEPNAVSAGEQKKLAGTPVPVPKPAIASPPPRSSGKFSWPAKGEVISKFGPKDGGLHNDGINIKVPEGTPVRSVENGVVAYAGNELKGYGQLLLVRHADGLITAYAHNSKLLVKRGDSVTRGQIIGHAGKTGSVSQPQIHFEVRKGTKALDPLTYLESA
jgi:murein DD-endopeptidase MepM/ murein hydrolase activator NlpD